MLSFRDHLLSRIPEQMHHIALLGKYFLPGTLKATPEQCYWAAGGDPSRDGTPVVQLLQGVRDSVTGEVHPEWLWQGKTVIDQVNLKLVDTPYKAEAIFFPRDKCFEIYVHNGSKEWLDYKRVTARR
jgi:hypothetical protein